MCPCVIVETFLHVYQLSEIDIELLIIFLMDQFQKAAVVLLWSSMSREGNKMAKMGQGYLVKCSDGLNEITN